jgi:transposase-like protein
VPELPTSLDIAAVSVSKARHDAAKSAKAAGTATAKAARRLDRVGLSRRDTAEVLGISHQRVQQLLVS